MDNIDDVDLREQMLVRETKAIAASLGLKVSDVEEALSLERGLQESTADTPSQQPIFKAEKASSALEQTSGKDDNEEKEMEEGRGESETSFRETEVAVESGPSCDVRLTHDQKQASKWWLLPQEMADKILHFIGDPDMVGYLAQVARSNGLRPSEMAAKHLSYNIYPRQFGAKTGLNIANWGNSWRSLLINRPRMRTNGFYSLKTLYTKPPTNDSFDDPKIYGSIETAYYRHFRFFYDGRVLYSPSLLDPWDIAEKLYKARPIEKAIYLGSYTAKGRLVSVSVQMHYCTMLFELEILDGCQSYSNYPGKHSVLRILKHYQVLPSTQEFLFPLPINCDCRFWREWNFSPSQPLG